MKKLFHRNRSQKEDIDSCDKRKSFWLKLISGAIGLFALAWFLIRVIPKPSRATYPCQRVAFPLASTFVVYIVGMFTTAIIFRQAKKRLHQCRYVLAGICIIIGLSCAWFTVSFNSQWAIAAGSPGPYDIFVPREGGNSPIGVARGINPGRVVWAYDPDATSWDGAANYYWDDAHTDQTSVDQMLSESLRYLTDESTDEDAWDAIFRNFNLTHDKGDIGYQAGEKIMIKPNHVEQRKHADLDNEIDMCAQVTLALIWQLVNKGGVDASLITLCDPTRYIADKTYDKLYAEFPTMVFEETTFYTDKGGVPGNIAGRVMLTPSDTNLVYYSSPTGDPGDGNTDRLATSFIEASYMINLAILKGHGDVGFTLTGKNLYGAPCDRNPDALHNSRARENTLNDQYRAIVDLMGHAHLGGKTLLYMVDGLWGTWKHHDPPDLWAMAPFNGDYPSSLFISQDPVAIDSVCLDFLYTEWADEWTGIRDFGEQAIEDYLHEAALAGNPGSGTVYAPDGPDKSPGSPYRLESLGVHEHWNNLTDKQYTRNLGTGDGVELVSITKTGHWAPHVYAGDDQSILLPVNSVGLTGFATDDGLPASPGRVTATWSRLEGPAAVFFGDLNDPVTTATFSECGTYVLRLSADDGEFTTTDDITVDVTMPSDLYTDCQVNLKDFAILAFHWQTGNCDEDNQWCDGADNDGTSQNGDVDINDLAYFVINWLY